MTRTFLVLTAALLAAGCGGAAEVAPLVEPSRELVTLVPPGTAGPLLGFELPAGQRAFAVTGGVASADGRSYVVASPSGGGTELRRYHPATGAVAATARLAGRWHAGAASADGRFVALVAADPTKGSSTFAVHSDGAPLTMVTLPGSFELDGLAPDGSTLFLVERFADGRYAVRAYDLAARRLSAGSIRVKNEEEEMKGVSGAQVATPDGEWLLTLFTNADEREAFVHALNLRERYALCLDLPSGAELDKLAAYGLALDGGGTTLYAANPALGLVSRLDLGEPGAMTTSRFDPLSTPGAATVAAVTRDGGTLAFAAGSEVWVYDTAARAVRGRASAKGQITGIAVGRDGAYAVASYGTLLKIAG